MARRAHVFSGDPAVHARLTAGLLILAVMQLPGAIAFAFDGALIGAHDLPPALRWSMTITRYFDAHSVMGLIGAIGWLHTAIVDFTPAGANARTGNPLPYSS